jgi:Uma2 family endonuclease
MSTSVPPALDIGDMQERPYRPFSVAEYHKLAEFGILSGDDRVELLDGVISPKMIHSPIHDAVVSHVEQQLRLHLLPSRFVRIQSSVTLDNSSEPEPDIAVVRGTPLDYLHRHPSGEDLEMVIEVAETSITRDRFKGHAYASAGIPIYWIINLKQKQIECYQLPKGADYSSFKVFSGEDSLELGPSFGASFTLKVSDLMPAIISPQ